MIGVNQIGEICLGEIVMCNYLKLAVLQYFSSTEHRYKRKEEW